MKAFLVFVKTHFISLIVTLSLVVSTVAVLQIKPWQDNFFPTPSQSAPAETSQSGEPAPSGEPGPSGETGVLDPEGNPDDRPDQDKNKQKQPRPGEPGEPGATGENIDLLNLNPGSSVTKLATKIFTIQFVTNGGSPLNDLKMSEGSRLGGLPVPYKSGAIFTGWYYDAALTSRVSDNQKIQGDLTLYAKFDDAAPLAETETPKSAIQLDQTTDFSFVLIAPESMTAQEVQAAISAKNITNPAQTDIFSVSGSNGRFTITGKDGSFEAGSTYKFVLEDESLSYEGYGESVREYHFTTAMAEVLNLALNESLIYIPSSDVSDFVVNGEGTTKLSIPLATTDLGTINYTSGSFVYVEKQLKVGDSVAIYKGERPDLRGINDDSQSGEVAYIQIVSVSGTTYTFKNASAEDVIFTPDVLPVNTASDLDGNRNDQSIEVALSTFDFSDPSYAALGLDDDTTVDIGDFIAFYTGDLEDPTGTASYGRITAVSRQNQHYVIAFDRVDLDEVMAAMDLYDNQDVDGDRMLSAVNRAALEEKIKLQAINSGFVEEAARYLTALTFETDEFTRLEDDFDLSGYDIQLANHTPVAKDQIQLMAEGSKIEVKVVELKPTIDKNLKHFEGLEGVRCTLKVVIEISIDTGEDSKIVIAVTGYFEQEVRISVNARGGAVWKWWGIFPYIDEYQLNANIDVYEYTGISIEANIATKEKDEEWDWDLDNAGENMAKQLKDLLDAKDKYVGDGEDTVADGLNDKYAAMLENESDWVDLFDVTIFENEGSVDPFHILVYEFEGKFAIQANMNISIGCDFYYESAKRYNYSIGVFNKTCTNETIDLVEEHYEFTFYVMGTMGLRAGLKFGISVGVFSTKLASLGITAEAGVYLKVWGYFYYELSYTASGGKKSRSSGALYFELGIYLEIAFEAQAFKGTFSYNPTLYENEWPLWSAGMRENVQAFMELEEEITEITLKKHIQTYAVPDDLFVMSYLDLKSGETDDKFFDDTEYFTFEITNSVFTYDPKTNTLQVTPDGDQEEAGEMVITWKAAPLTFTSQPIQRTIDLAWDNYNDGYAVVFNSLGGTAVPMILTRFGAELTLPAEPTKQGYDFAGWFTDTSFQTPYVLPETMPNYDIEVFAKWQPRSDTAYQVAHYLQNLNNNLYTLDRTETLYGTTDSTVTPAAQVFEGFAPPALRELTILPDGSALLKYYYSRNRYTLTFKQGIDNGQADWVYQYKYGASIFTPQLSAAGYQFAGWDPTVLTIMPASNLTFTAQWQASQDTPYRIEHFIQNTQDDGYTLHTAEYKSGVTLAELTLADLTLSASGITYQHGTVSGQQVAKTTIAKDGKRVIKLFYSRNTYQLTMNLVNGTNTVIDYRYDAPLTEPIRPSRAGYTFSGWFWEGSLATPVDFTADRMPADNLTLYGKLTANTQTPYRVEHYVEQADGNFTLAQSDDLTGITDLSFNLRDKIAESLLIPGGITYRDGTVSDAVVSSTTIAGDGTLVCKLYYVRTRYSLTFKLENGLADIVRELRYGSAITAPENPTRTGYTFTGWDQMLAATLLNANLTYTAQWTPRTDTAYQVKHIRQSLDGTYPADGALVEVEGKTGTTAANTAAAARTYTGFTAGTFTQTAIAADGSTEIVIRYSRNQHSVTWKADEDLFKTTKLAYGQAIAAPATLPVKTGYVLAGWTGLVEGAVMPDQSVVFSADWAPATDTAYTVRHLREDLSGSYTLEETEPKAGTTGSDTAAAAKSYTGFTVQAAPIAQAKIAADGASVVEVRYNRNSYTLRWLADGQAFKTGQLRFEAPIVEPDTVPTKTGYDFTGWGTVPETMPAETLELTANFTGQSYVVTFSPSYGDEAGETITQTFGESYELPETKPVRPGYAFDGWFTAATGGSRVDANTTLQTNRAHTLYAQWVVGTNTKYTVEHYQQNVSDDLYTQVKGDTQELTGITDADSNATAKSYVGFTAKAIDQETINGDGSIVVKVYYDRNSYPLTFKPDTGDTDDQVRVVRFGAAITAPSNPVKPGYVFVGWGSLAATMPANALTYTAQWTAATYQVTFDAQGGSLSDNTKTVTYNSTYGTMPTPTRTGYLFDGWFTAASDGTLITSTSSVFITTNTTLFAHWTAKTYAVAFDPNGGSVGTTSKRVTYGSSYGTLPAATRTGYTLSGWYTATSGGALISSTSPVTITSDTVLYAQWTANTYQVAFAGNGSTSGSMSSQDITYDTSRNLTANTYLRTGYRFIGWATTSNGDVVYVDQASVENLSATPGATVTLYAQWEQELYTIQFNSNGGSFVATRTGLTYGTPILAPASPTLTGYTFAGWYQDVALENPLVWGLMPAQNLNLYAKWNLDSYNIAYVLNGGINHGSNPATYTIKTDSLTLGTPTRTGYTFNGWYSDAALSNQVTGVAIASGSMGDRTFYAKWTVNDYKIDYQYLNGASHTNPSSYTVNDAVTLANPASRPGYSFAGWYTDSGLQQPVMGVAIPSGSSGPKTFFAKWTIISYKITYELNGGTNSSDNPASYTVASPAIRLSDPADRTGYTFSGWYTDGSFTNKITDIAIPAASTGVKTFYAKWTEDTYTIQYLLNDGTNNASNPANYTITTPTITLGTPTRNGYTFQGWYATSDFSGATITTIPLGSTGTKSFHAKWSLVSYTITYHLNGATNGANPTTYTVETPTITLKNATKTADDIFIGWFTNSTFTGSPITDITQGSTGDLNLYAKLENYGRFSVINNGNNTFTIARTGGSDGPQTVYYRTQNGSAIGGTHFTHVDSSVVFSAGETSKTITVSESPTGVTALYDNKAVTAYTNADRVYFLDLVKVVGGGKLSETIQATRTMAKNSNYHIDASVLYSYQVIKSVSYAGWVVKEDPDGGSYKDTLSVGLSSPVMPDSKYSENVQAYLRNTAAGMKIQLRNFKGYDDGWRMWRFVLFNNHNANVSFSSSKNSANIPNLPSNTDSALVTYSALVYGIKDDVNNRDDYAVQLPGTIGDFTAQSGTTRVLRMNDIQWAEGQDKTDYVLYGLNETCGISIGAYNSAGANSWWKFTGGSLYAAPKDNKEPAAIGVAPMASQTFVPGDRVVIAVVFDEIVSSATNVTISTDLSNSPFTLAGGLNSNILYFSGTVTNNGSSAPTLSNIIINNKTNIYDLCE